MGISSPGGEPVAFDESLTGGLDAQGRPRAALPFWSRYSRPLYVDFPKANIDRPVAHGLGTRPDGMFVIRADAEITAVVGKSWDDLQALLKSNVDNAHSIVVFFILREEPTIA